MLNFRGESAQCETGRNPEDDLCERSSLGPIFRFSHFMKGTECRPCVFGMKTFVIECVDQNVGDVVSKRDSAVLARRC